MTDKPISILRALIALAGKASDGRWMLSPFHVLTNGEHYTEVLAPDRSNDLIGVRSICVDAAHRDAAFIAAARNAVPDMEAVLADNERLTAEVADLKDADAACSSALSALTALRGENEKLTRTSREDHAIFQHELRLANGRTAALRGQVEAERESCALVAEADKGDDCPFSVSTGPLILATDPCPVCGDLGIDEAGPSRCHSSAAKRISAAIRARAALATPEEGKK